MFRYNQCGLAVHHLVHVVHVRVGHDGFHHGVADDVSEGNLAAAGALELLVHHAAVFEHQLGGHVAHGGCGGHFEGNVHVLGDRLGNAFHLGAAGRGHFLGIGVCER